jgi:hypothetical protein
MKQKTDIRARSNIPRFPWTRGALPRQATVRAHRHRSSTGIDRNTLIQCPPHHTRRTTAQRTQHTATTDATPRNFPTPRRSEAPLLSYREHGRTFPNQRANAGS